MKAWHRKREAFENVELEDVEKVEKADVYRWPRNVKDDCNKGALAGCEGEGICRR